MKLVQKWTRKLVAAGPALLGGLSIFSAVNASDVFVSETGRGAGQASGSLVLPVGTNNYWAGLQTIAVTPNPGGASATSFLAYCIDPAHYSTSAYTAYYGPTPVSTAFASQAPAIQVLFNEYYAGALNNNANAAAFQLALWEIADDDGNLFTGTVRTTGSTKPGLVSSTSTLLNNLSQLSYSGQNVYNLNVYRVDRAVAGLTGQDYIVAGPIAIPDNGGATPIPEPGSFALILAGLGTMMLFPRRRRPV